MKAKIFGALTDYKNRKNKVIEQIDFLDYSIVFINKTRFL